MNCRNLLLGPTLLLGGFFGAANNANAWSFYWSKVEVQTSSWQNCMNIAFRVSKNSIWPMLSETISQSPVQRMGRRQP